MQGCCIYCYHFTGSNPSACITYPNGKDYGHDYSYDEDFVKKVKDILVEAEEVAG